MARDVLSFPGPELPAGREIRAPHERLADGFNPRWIQRYQPEAG